MTLQNELARAFLEERPREAALALERMPAADRAGVVSAAPEEAAAALSEMVASAAAECLALSESSVAAMAVDRLEPDVAVAMLRRMPADVAERLLAALPERKREPLRRTLRYPEGTAGAVMDPMVLAIPDDITVGEARVRLRGEAHGLLYYLFVIDRGGMLRGVLDIAELMRARARDPIESVMNSPVEQMPAWTPAAAVRAHPGWRSFHAMPVTDEAGRFAGAIRYQTLRRLEHEADAAGASAPTGQTVGALGELFHLGLAGFVEGVAGVAATRGLRSPHSSVADEKEGDAR
ncbi:MAG TPA: CBS domain-containing protein [Thermoanaerobaculia bacterium]|nr:CBS domain-containing protein [Thermoanaerobaculia bacterium]